MNDTTFQGNGSVKYVPVVVDTKPKPITNGDKIRASSDEELAAFIADDLCELLCGAPLACDGQCKQKMLDWLREVATDGEQD